jgi:hypothetical protein
MKRESKSEWIDYYWSRKMQVNKISGGPVSVNSQFISTLTVVYQRYVTSPWIRPVNEAQLWDAAVSQEFLIFTTNAIA